MTSKKDSSKMSKELPANMTDHLRHAISMVGKKREAPQMQVEWSENVVVSCPIGVVGRRISASVLNLPGAHSVLAQAEPCTKSYKSMRKQYAHDAICRDCVNMVCKYA